MEGNREQYEEDMAAARNSGEKAAQYIAKNNEMVKKIQREVGQLGANTLIRNRGIKLLAGISFLEELDVLDTPREKDSQIQGLMNRLSSAHQDAMVAAAEFEKFIKAAEKQKYNYEQKKKLFEETCGQ
ncbi:MAG TPA: hypothetical protein VIG74_05570 [Alphaproteobacteria bacterium]|jgi:hypothetical protein